MNLIYYRVSLLKQNRFFPGTIKFFAMRFLKIPKDILPKDHNVLSAIFGKRNQTGNPLSK